MKKVLILAFIVCCSQLSFSQEYLQIYGNTTGEVDSVQTSRLKGAKVGVYNRNDSLIQYVETKSNGSFNLDSIQVVPFLKIRFEKEGYVSKSADLNLTGCSKDNDYGKLRLQVDLLLFQEDASVNLDFLKEEPVVKFFYDPKSGGLRYYSEHLKEMKSKIEYARCDCDIKEFNKFYRALKSTKKDKMNEICPKFATLE